MEYAKLLVAMIMLCTTSSMCVHTLSTDGCECQFRGPSDVVILLDRSESVSEKRFGEYKKLVTSLVKRTMQIGPENSGNYSRLGVITFAADAFIDLDLISDPQGIYPCELFAKDGQFDTRVAYVRNQQDVDGVGIQEALKMSENLFLKRSDIHRKLLFVVSDFETSMVAKTTTGLSDIRFRMKKFSYSFEAYGIGGGTFFNVSNMLTIFQNDTCAARRQKEWESCVAGVPPPYSRNKHPVTDRDVCCNMCGVYGPCTCRENTRFFYDLNGTICQPVAKCPSQFPDQIIPEYAWTLLLAVIVFLGGVVLVMAAMAGVLHWRRTRSRQNSTSQKTGFDALTGGGELTEPRAEAPSPPDPARSIQGQEGIGWPFELQRSSSRSNTGESIPSDDGYLRPLPPSSQTSPTYTYAARIPRGVALPGGNHSTRTVSSHIYDDTEDPRTTRRREIISTLLSSVKRKLNILLPLK